MRLTGSGLVIGSLHALLGHCEKSRANSESNTEQGNAEQKKTRQNKDSDEEKVVIGWCTVLMLVVEEGSRVEQNFCQMILVRFG